MNPLPSSPGFDSRGGHRRRPWLRLATLSILAPLVALAAGCASYMSAQVTSFHQLGGADHRFAGQAFFIEPAAAQRDSLEFRAYADLVRQALIRQGLVDAPEASAALAVSVRYSIDNGRYVVYGYPAYGYAGFGPAWGWAPYYHYGHYHGRGSVSYAVTATYPLGYGMVGPGYSQSVVYQRELRVDISDRRAGGGGAKLFEGSVVTEGESASLAPVMPAMVQALFSDFPGPNGVARRVHVRLDAPPGAAVGYPPAPPPGSAPASPPAAPPGSPPVSPRG